MTIIIGHTAADSANCDVICIFSAVPVCLLILYSILDIYQPSG